MSFRDDRDAMRARIEELEASRAREQETVARAEAAEAELVRLRARVAELDRSRAEAAPRSETPNLLRPLAVTLLVVGVLYGIASRLLPMTVTHAHAAPSVTVVDLDETPDPVTVEGTAGGWRWAPPGCVGSYPSAPQLVIENRSPTWVHFSLTGGALLVLLDAEGQVRCEPALRAMLPPGEQRVWVGGVDGEHPFTLALERSER